MTGIFEPFRRKCTRGPVRRSRQSFGIWTLMTAALEALSLQAAQQTRTKPIPSEPIASVVNAFRTHDIVTLSAGVGHGDQRGRDFELNLLRNRDLALAIDDIVVESGSARYQDAMDSYVRGDDVPVHTLRKIWDDTTQQQVPGPMWDGDVPALYRAVRDTNRGLPSGHQLRVLLGDPPIEWERVHTGADFGRWMEQRDSYPADLIRREVLAKRRRALVLYGSGHLQRKNQISNYDMTHPLAQTVVSLLERAGTQVYVITSVDEAEGSASWPVPSLVPIRGTTLGAISEPVRPMPRMTVRDGGLVPIPKEQWTSLTWEEQLDALLYLGPPSSRTAEPLPRAICADMEYFAERIRRLTLERPGSPLAQRLREYCSPQ